MSYDIDCYNLAKLPNQSLAVTQCGITIYHPGHETPKDLYKNYAIHFILEGKGTFIHNGVSTPLRAGQGFLIPPNTTCSYVADEKEPWKYVYVIFRGADDDALVRNAGLSESNIFFDFPTDEEMLRTLYAMHRAGKKNEAMGYDVTGYFLLAMSRLVKAAKGSAGEAGGKHYVKRAIRFMQEHYHHPIEIAHVAAHVNLDRTYLYRLFMKCEGVSPSDYLLQLRLKAAARLLKDHDLPIREIATNAGFGNLSYFYKCFGRAYGLSPKQYREQKNKG